MKRLLLPLLALPLFAAEPNLSEQLRDALYTEEVTRDPAAAAVTYAKILADFDTQRPLAATALFRLAEIRRNADDKDQAIALYQRLLQEFPDREAESKLAREHLAELGGKTPSPTGVEDNALEKEIRKFREMAKNSPDIFHGSADHNGALYTAVDSGNIKLVEAVIELGADPLGNDVLPLAVGNGLFEICKLLLEKGGMPNERESVKALEYACDDSQLELLKLLLDQGLDANSPIPHWQNQFKLPIHVAIENESLKAAALLLEHGAEVNSSKLGSLPEIGDAVLMSPLVAACTEGYLEGVRFLLDYKADPNLTDPETNRTPLLSVTGRQPDYAKIVELLLKNGADPNTSSKEWKITPLLQAAGGGSEAHLEILKLLLKHGADPNHRVALRPRIPDGKKDYREGKTALDLALKSGNLDMIEALLDAGAKITSRDLRSALDHKNPNLFGIYLKHLPDFEPDDPAASALLMEAAKKSKDILPLIERGASPSEEWIESGFDNADWDEAVPILNERFLFPKIASPEQIQLVRTAWWNSGQTISTLVSRSGDSAPPSLARPLFDADLKLPQVDGREVEVRWFLWRKDNKGFMTATNFDPASNDPLPEMKWGDIVEVRTKGQPISNGFAMGGNKFEESYATSWNLRRRIRMPIKFTIGESTCDLTLRGDLLVFDPTKNEVPLVPVGSLIPLLKPAPYFGAATLTIRREGLQDVVLAYSESNRPSWPQFDLQPNDHLILETPLGTAENSLKLRRRQIALKTPGVEAPAFVSPITRQEFAPTLVEVIAATYSPLLANWHDGFPSQSPSDLGMFAKHILNAKVLPHPDFSKLRILRIDSEGHETKLKIDLTEVISKCTPETSAADARSSDIPLQAGDIIELPLLASSQPWTGFSEELILYFKKVLNGAVQITDSDGKVSMKEINWQPMEWITFSNGLLPNPSQTGASSTRAWDLGLSFYEMELTRHNKELGEINRHVILRNRDRIKLPPRTKKRVHPSNRGTPAPKVATPRR